MRRILALALASVLTAAPALGGGQESGKGPRTGPDIYPPWLIRVLEPVAEPFGRTASHIVWRSGRIGRKADAMALLARALRPLDVVLTKSRGRLTGRLIPGLFTHAVVYLGTERELRALGVWNTPEVRPHQGAIRAGKTWIEAVSRRVKLSGVKKAVDADQLVLLRPRLGASSKRRAALDLFAHLGAPYDYHMNAAEDDALFCAELVGHAMAIALPRREQYGRTTIVPADIAAQALAGRGSLSVVLYLKADREGWLRGDKATLRQDLREGW